MNKLYDKKQGQQSVTLLFYTILIMHCYAKRC